MIVEFIIRFMVSICIFLFGMNIMTKGLEKASSKSMKKVFNKLGNNKLKGVGVGTVATVATSSSTAVTVLTIGLVNAGVLTLFQAVNIIMGSNIGTTVSGLMVALDGLNLSLYFSFFTVVGFLFISVSDNKKLNKIGEILIGFGLVFVGMLNLSSAITLISNESWFIGLFTIVSNPIILVLIGMAVTGVIQSSSAVTALIIVLVGANVLDVVDAIFITLGTNIGTCFSSILASTNTSTVAKRVSMFHLIFNVLSTVLFLIPLMIIGRYNTSMLMSNLFGNTLEFQIAWFNFWQNLISTVVMLPFVKQLIILCEVFVPDNKEGRRHVNDNKEYFY